MRWLWTKVSTNRDYLDKTGERTRYVTALIVEKMLAEPVVPGGKDTVGDMPIRYFTRDTLEALRDRRADTPEAPTTSSSACCRCSGAPSRSASAV
jgi:hypothetical protein